MGRPIVVPCSLVRKAALPAHPEPVTFGIPFARGTVAPADRIEVGGPEGRPIPAQVRPLALWPDGSVRWALIDVVVEAGERAREQVTVSASSSAAPSVPAARVLLREAAAACTVETGAMSFTVPKDTFAPFAAASCRSRSAPAASSRITLEGGDGRILVPRLDRLAVETGGPLRLTLRGEGEFRSSREKPLARFVARLSFFAGTALVRLDFTIHNPKRARHPGGVWDLGDPGSVFFRDLSIQAGAGSPGRHRIGWRTTAGGAETVSDGGEVEIYQGSSGGENWRCRSHVDRHGRVPLPFRGCRITHAGQVEHVERADPVLSWSTPGMRITAAMPKFWQQFPSALEANGDGLRIGLFPHQFDELFELQGGEQKTHTVFLLCEPDAPDVSTAGLRWVHDPLVPCVPPQHFAASGVFPHFVAACDDPHADYVRLMEKAIDGPASFFAKREAIDEYGWRNFGDTWADHEDVHFAGEHPVISHYNNQYDLVYGLLLHFARSADPRWCELASDLARHVIDIDLYHTTEDRPAYNGGLFWHTDHYQGAGRATHRSYTAESPLAKRGREYGGGPSSENNYTTGLLIFHYLTGDPAAGEAVRGLADWVLRMDDGSESLLGYLAPGPTGLATRTRDDGYHGPGRGAGNSVNALIDAFVFCGEPRYLAKAEELIARSVHPRDDPGKWNLGDPETRWSYLVFLQALGKYLDLKDGRGERDAAFAYARASLLRYADWMLAHETPFMTRFDRVEYPTESWPAQDMRKSFVFDYAAKYGPPHLRERFAERAETYFRESLDGVLSFEGHAYTRPLAVLLSAGSLRAGFRLRSPEASDRDDPDPEPDFGVPQPFVTQKERARRRLGTPSGLLALARAALRPSVLRRVLAGRIW